MNIVLERPAPSAAELEPRLGPLGAARAVELLSHVGRTPLVELIGLPGQPADVRILAKLEARNPGGSIKDRPVARMLLGALARGDVTPGATGRRLLDSSSGNAAIAYAMLGSALGVPVTLVVPGNASRERLERIRAHGAELVLTDPLDGYDHAVHTAKRLFAEQPERYWYSNQYANEDNWRAHFDTTGAEILAGFQERTGAPPDAFVSGVGTGGTLTGVGRRLRAAHAGVHIAALAPDVFPGIEGLKPLGSPGDFIPPILDQTLIDRHIPVRQEEAVPMCHALAKLGFFAGPSSGANLWAAVELAKTGRFRTVATLLCDTGERYGSTGLWAVSG